MAQKYNLSDLTIEQKIEIINYVTSFSEISFAKLQIKFIWGYNRAGNVINWLTSLGVISHFDGSHHRKVLMSKEAAINLILN